MIETFKSPRISATLYLNGTECRPEELACCLQLHPNVEPSPLCYGFTTGEAFATTCAPVLQILTDQIPAYRWAELLKLKKEQGLESVLQLKITLPCDYPPLTLQLPTTCLSFLEETQTSLSVIFESEAPMKSKALLYKGKLSLCGQALPKEEIEKILNRPATIFSEKNGMEYLLFEGEKNAAPTVASAFFEELSAKAEALSDVLIEKEIEKNMEWMLYPMESYDFSTAFSFPPHFIATAKKLNCIPFIGIG